MTITTEQSDANGGSQAEIGARVMARLETLAQFSDESGRLTRLYLSTAHGNAAQWLLAWMRDLGLEASIDAIGNVVGRYEGAKPRAPTLMIGSHLDTVRDAGCFDGALGIVVALTCVEEFVRQQERLPFAIEVVAFGDEEGVRFPCTLNGSRALAGTFDPKALDQVDRDGVSLRQALVSFGCDPGEIANLARHHRSLVAFVEVHIEQGPVLEQRGLPVGIVTAISGAVRFDVKVTGVSGHAGTVPMHVRHDPMTAAAHMVVCLSKLLQGSDAVATVGKIEAQPGAVNVIPACVHFTLDLRSPDDHVRYKIVHALTAEFEAIAKSHRVSVDVVRTHEIPTVSCDPRISRELSSAVDRHQLEQFHLPSGAGHDAMSFDRVCPIGILFVRCRGGVSHHPDEAITEEDAGIATTVLLDFLRHLKMGGSTDHDWIIWPTI